MSDLGVSRRGAIAGRAGSVVGDLAPPAVDDFTDPATDLVEAFGRGFFVPSGVLALAGAGDAGGRADWVALVATDVGS